MSTDKDMLVKGLKHLAYTVLTMFLAPLVLFQAFKNQDHQFFIPVLIIGVILAILAIGLGFYSIKIFIDALFGKKRK